MDENAVRAIIEQVIHSALAAGSIKTDSAPLPISCDAQQKLIPVELSARHAHLSEADAIALFGHPLTPDRDLSQPGEFLSKERVRLIGPKGVIDNVAVLGPGRNSSQVEISKTDARILGINAPVRQSGDVKDSPGIILASESNIVALNQGLIVASRHIHMTPEDAVMLEVADKDMVSVRIESERPVILEDVLIRVSPQFKLAMHIDFDEGNSAGWNKKVFGKIVAKNGNYNGLCRC